MSLRSSADEQADHARAVVLCAIAVYFICFSLVALTTEYTLPLDVIEQIGWSRDPQWVYFKHPPLPAWTLAFVLGVTRHSPTGAAVLGPLTCAIALTFLWLLSKRIFDSARAAIAVLVSAATAYFTLDSLEFNHNLIQLPLWSLIAYAGHRAWSEAKPVDWIFLGCAAALGILGKYSTALLLLSLIAAFVIDASARRQFRSFGPWLAIGTAVVLLTPHLLGLSAIRFLPLQFPFDRAQTAKAWSDHLIFPIQWLIAQLPNVAAALVLALLLISDRRKLSDSAIPAARDRDTTFILALFAGPFILSEAIQAVGGIRFLDMWGMPMWALLGPVLIVLTASIPFTATSIRRFTVGWCALFVLNVTATAATNIASPYLTHRGDRLHFPSAQMVQAIDAQWRTQTGDKPIKVAVGDCWLSGIFAAYDASHPSVMTDGSSVKSPWITANRLQQSGAVLLWDGSDEMRPLLKQFPRAELQKPLVLPYRTNARVPPVKIGWAILRPGTGSAVEAEHINARLVSSNDPCGRPAK